MSRETKKEGAVGEVGVLFHQLRGHKAALAAGADGVMVEAHMSPMEALSDRFQQLTMKEFEDLFSEFLLK